MLCSKCLSNYYLDSNSKKCLPLDPESISQKEKKKNLEDEEKEETSPELDGLIEVIGSILVVFILSALVLMRCKTF